MSNQTISYFIKWINRSKCLYPKEEDILIKRLRKIKLRQIGRKYHVSDERIRQIEKDALKKLQSTTVQERLL